MSVNTEKCFGLKRFINEERLYEGAEEGRPHNLLSLILEIRDREGGGGRERGREG